MTRPDYTISQARRRDLSVIPRIERAAARLLAGHAPRSVLSETTSRSRLLRAQRRGHLWVALFGEVPVGFAHVVITDCGFPHLEELDVDPAHGRRGLGTRLVTAVCEWASASCYEWITLTTFRDVPWNMPFYARVGFEVVPPAAVEPCLLTIVDNETRRGLDPHRRVVMRKHVGPGQIGMSGHARRLRGCGQS